MLQEAQVPVVQDSLRVAASRLASPAMWVEINYAVSNKAARFALIVHIKRNIYMASNIDFVQYITDQCSGAGEIEARKMFGDWGMYCNGKIFGLVSDNGFYVKPTEAGRKMLRSEMLRPPYESPISTSRMSTIANTFRNWLRPAAPSCQNLVRRRKRKRKRKLRNDVHVAHRPSGA